MEKSIAYYSLGCKVNLYETESIINDFLDLGFKLKKFSEVCDVYIINTCTVTHTGDSKSRKIIREAIARNKNAVVAVMGCYSQLRPFDIEEIDGVDIIIGTYNRTKLLPLILEKLNKKERKADKSLFSDIMKEREYEEMKLKRFTDKTRGFVKIQDGCDNYCTYCTVPYSRGHIRSRKIEDCVDEIKRLSDNGMKEIVLSGINTGAYGKDLGISLVDLLKEVVKIENLGRIRISSIEETEITKELLELIKANEKHFCSHFHVPLQAACDNTLKRMKRKYDVKTYQEKIEMIRSYFEDVNITVDILAGFSGETEEDFKEGLKFIESMNFGEMHVFPYSRREHTLAYHFDNIIDSITKKKRVNDLLSLNIKKALEYRNLFLHKCVEVLVEKNNKGICFGHSSNYLEVEFEGDNQENDLVNVEIIKVDYPKCIGRRI
ncbi:MAG: tRNA (N(6)-L-threonylcarbamoyladenosine(37)-C(2))-methylthiotransferase MtaB [Bacilli bacterium]|nr:tRNA (N(6)-L-threonylcarbamoyladenosine(37)-C(2))-methylthiotransferase MtaB [Bacilli bacterium]